MFSNKFIFFFIVLIPALTLTTISFAEEDVVPTGNISGVVIDKTTKQPLPGANIIISGTTMGSIANDYGKFVISNVPVGQYTVQITMMGYEPLAKTDIIVKPTRTTFLTIELTEVAIKADEVVVVGTRYFEKTEEATTSHQTISNEEVRRTPGANYDVQRIVRLLPSVANMGDQINDLVVRGGAPNENLTVMDNIEIPNSNHFGFQGMGGGPINAINTDFVDDVTFIAGGFLSKYGDKASSVMDIDLKEGPRNEYNGSCYAHFAGFGANIEGPIGKKASFLLSARESFMEVMSKSGAFGGMTAVPEYYDIQSKLAYEINPEHKVVLNLLWGDDNIEILEGKSSGYGTQKQNVKYKSDLLVAGGYWRALWTKKAFSVITISNVTNHWTTNVTDSLDKKFYTNKSMEAEYNVKGELTYKASPRFEITLGSSYKPVKFEHRVWLKPDTNFVIYNPSLGNTDTVRINGTLYALYPYKIDYKTNVSSYKSALFMNFRMRPLKKLTANIGGRYDYFEYTNHYAISPRIGLSYELTNRTSLNIAYGNFYQTPTYISLTIDPKNKNLKYIKTTHYIAGIEHLITDDFKSTIEVYYKDYDDYPVSASYISADKYDRGDVWENAGVGITKGVELFLQKKLTTNWYGTFSYSFCQARAKVPIAERPEFKNEFSWDYDFEHLSTIMGGYNLKLMDREWFKNLKKQWYYNFPVGIFVSDIMEFSFRWSYVGGKPYTKQVYNWDGMLYERDDITNNIKPKYVWSDYGMKPNAERYPAYHSLNLRVDNKHIFKNWNLITFWDIGNVYNRKNVSHYQYNDDGTVETVYQFGFFPLGGISIEF